MSYGPSASDLFRARCRVCRPDSEGRQARPFLPIEQPTKFELVVNLKTAGAIGIKLPTGILIRAECVASWIFRFGDNWSRSSVFGP
jgi:putative tryptophan/tyrosine transport system substrate-binding protein